MTIEEDRVGKDDGWKNETERERKGRRRKCCEEGKFSIQFCPADHRTRHQHALCPVSDFCLTTYFKRDSFLQRFKMHCFYQYYALISNNIMKV